MDGRQCGGFFKSSFSGSTSTCVEVSFDGDGEGGTVVRVRSSRQADGPVLVFDREEWQAFELGVFNGEFAMPC